jgi:hypothetical protein
MLKLFILHLIPKIALIEERTRIARAPYADHAVAKASSRLVDVSRHHMRRAGCRKLQSSPK